METNQRKEKSKKINDSSIKGRDSKRFYLQSFEYIVLKQLQMIILIQISNKLDIISNIY
jgi:hypothetical protein